MTLICLPLTNYGRHIGQERNVAKQPKLILWAETGHQLPTEEHRSSLLRWLQESLK